ncbi:MAG: sodium-dependent transporter [Tyzzerella sp.]|nr:sodium-dependent transporter [Tyzzerella sp.]
MNQRSNFTSKIGFVLAAAGSAVGLGNLWRFPYLAAQYGGGTFLLVYLILAVTFGFALMIAEIAIGRKTGLSAIGAYKALDKRFGFVGVLTAAVPIIILPYYSVIGGWVIKYFVTFISGDAHAAANDSYFGGFIGSPVEPIGWFFLFIALTAIIVLFGVEKGIEKVSKVMMPILAVLTVGIAVYVVTRPGAMDGVLYYLKPNFKDFSPTTVFAAMGQLFYSMSLAMGIMVTYGSYMKKDNHMEKSVRQIELFDTAIAFMAGLMIVPAAYTFYGGSTEELKKGPTLMFVILPKVFDQMPGVMGTVIGVAFFLLVFFAALTSSISLMETVVSIVMDKTKWGRKLTCIVVFVFSLLMGIPSSLGFNIWGHITFLNGLTFLDLFDFVSNSVIMPIVAFFTCVLVGFIIKPKAIADEVKETDGTFKSEKLFTVMIKWVAPIFILAILVFSVAEGMGWIAV